MIFRLLKLLDGKKSSYSLSIALFPLKKNNLSNSFPNRAAIALRCGYYPVKKHNSPGNKPAVGRGIGCVNTRCPYPLNTLVEK